MTILETISHPLIVFLLFAVPLFICNCIVTIWHFRDKGKEFEEYRKPDPVYYYPCVSVVPKLPINQGISTLNIDILELPAPKVEVLELVG